MPNDPTLLHTSTELTSAFPAMPRIGWILTGLVVLFLAFDGITKILRVAPVMEACQKMGISPEAAVGIGFLLIICTALYVTPRTCTLGAILLTGFLGGAVATHIVAKSGTFPIFFSVGFGVLAWTALILREPRLVRWILLHQ